MSLCHIWFGVLRSKKRGFAGFRITFGFAAGISFCACSVRDTVAALVGRNKARLSHCAIRFTPNSGLAFLASTICACIAVSAPFARRCRNGLYRVCNPASPSSRYRFTHSNNVPLTTPSSCDTTPAGICSSKYNFTALRRNSTGQ
jgi:hypothetical protein